MTPPVKVRRSALTQVVTDCGVIARCRSSRMYPSAPVRRLFASVIATRKVFRAARRAALAFAGDRDFVFLNARVRTFLAALTHVS